MKTAKRWIVSAGACLLALTSMSVSFGQIPTAPIPEQNNDGLPLLTEPAPIDVSPVGPMQVPAAPADVPAPVVNAVPQTAAPALRPAMAVPAPADPAAQAAPAAAATPAAPAAPAAAATPAAPAAPAAAATQQEPCQQCQDPCQNCPPGAYYSPTPYYGMDARPWWLHIHPVPYTPVEHGHHGMGMGMGMGMGGGFGRPVRKVPVEPPFYTTRGPRDFYLDNPRPLGY